MSSPTRDTFSKGASPAKGEDDELQELRLMLQSGPASCREMRNHQPNLALAARSSAAEQAKRSAEANAARAAATAPRAPRPSQAPPHPPSFRNSQREEYIFSYTLVDGVTVCETERTSASALHSANARFSARRG